MSGRLACECIARAQAAVLYAAKSFAQDNGIVFMSVDTATVKRVARLARIAVTDAEAEKMKGELNAILGFVEQLDEVDVSGVDPMTSAVETTMRKRVDEVSAGDRADDIVANAPMSEDNFFMVPKVVE